MKKDYLTEAMQVYRELWRDLDIGTWIQLREIFREDLTGEQAITIAMWEAEQGKAI
jgi:hypothetical protein